MFVISLILAFKKGSTDLETTKKISKTVLGQRKAKNTTIISLYKEQKPKQLFHFFNKQKV